MNIPKKLIGRFVELTWLDPNSTRGPIEALPKGREALAVWQEYGVIHDVTDGVVLIAHSYAASPGEEKPDEFMRTAIPEVLIEKVKVYVEELPAQGS